MRRLTTTLFVSGFLLTGGLGASPAASAAPCEPRSVCFDLDSVSASLASTQPEVPATQAGAHPDLTLSFFFEQDLTSPPNPYGMHESFAPVRDLRVDTPPGLLGDPNVLGVPQQCTLQELLAWGSVGIACPNGSQVGTTRVFLHGFGDFPLVEPLYMMVPPENGDIVARLGFVAGNAPAVIDVRVRSERQDDFGVGFELSDIAPVVQVLGAETTTWGVPTSPAHDKERCTPGEALGGCVESAAKPPGTRPLSFITSPTRCGVPLSFTVSATSWPEPNRLVTESGEFPTITGCDKVPFKPSLFVEPTSHRAAAPTGLELSFRLPSPEGVGVLESSHLKDMRIDFPVGMGINAAIASGLGVCSAEQVKFGENVSAECPDAAKLGETEFDIPVLPRRMQGAIYLREPEPGHLFRVWVVADDLGAHIKLPGELEIDEGTGRIHSIVLDLPQAPVREVRLLLKSGFRAPLANPPACGIYQTHWEFTPWARPAEPIASDAPMTIDEGCDTGGFSPRLSAGSTNPAGGQHAPFFFAVVREDGEQNPASLDVALPPGLVASFRDIPRCEGTAAETGTCPVDSQIGRVLASTGVGPTPLWVPQADKKPTAVYLGGPYKGAPLSAIAVVPAQAGPFDLGDVVVRSAIFVDPETALATVKSDPLPQFIQGVPILYRITEVILDRPSFTLNPTDCSPTSVDATVRSAQGAVAQPSAYFQAAGCARLPFKPRLAIRLIGGTHRGDFPRLRAILRARDGDANIGAAQVILPGSEFVENAHFVDVCTSVQFRADECPPDSVYGTAIAETPLFDFPLKGPVYLRTTPGKRGLPDLVAALRGPSSLPIKIDLVGNIDSVGQRLRTTFASVPDAPVKKFTLRMRGGPKGLIVNSANLCKTAHRAAAKFTAQNGKRRLLRPLVQVSCSKPRSSR
jgi:hypothetical protein